MVKQVFILCTGRSGSVSFINACQHITNYSSSHESRAHCLGDERLNFPENHIEADNRLSWFLGLLEEKYGNMPCYVHLLREKTPTVHSFVNRWGVKRSIIEAFEKGILILKPGRRSDLEKKAICELYYETVNANIRSFLQTKSNTLTLHLENIEEDFKKFWEKIGATGNLEAALAVFQKPVNTSSDRKTFRYKIRNLIYRLKTRFK